MAVQITLITTSGVEYNIELPGDLQVRDLLDKLLEELDLPITGPDGQGISYRLQTTDGTVLNEDETLEQAGVESGAEINLTSQIEAGCIPHNHSFLRSIV